DISFTIHQNEQWAIVGSSGSGKTLLANTLAGKNFFTGKINYYFPSKKNSKSSILIVEQQHLFKNLSNTNDLYYQQRFNSYDSEQTITVAQELQEHFSNQNFIDDEWLDVLHVRNLLNEPLIQLSNGENKRVQLAIALLETPELLILDNPFVGLDVEGRKVLHQIIQSISQKGIHVLLITSYNEIPEPITHIASLEKGNLIFADEKIRFQPNDYSTNERNNLDAELLQQVKPKTENDFNVAIKMINVNIKYDDKQILHNINWEVKKGECWNLSGPNGAGKSTLLSLITADNPQAYANEIYLFDKRRGSGESIWDIKKRIGFVSPELHLYFDFSATCFEVIASGLFDTIGLFRHLTDKQNENVLLWLKLFQLENLQAKRLSQISVSEQRRTLLARALIKTSPLLILDEPCQGLDDEQTSYFKNLINQICKAFDTTLVYVSHYQNQIPECVNHFLRLENGKVIS
ncbi:MAG TPA: ATP-binding cassette domain-containing protein, partial [Puia sp.]|nr:ATP-binding cassette domain-containing protein [Puia sp.]